nr:hypothetical protein [uncultured Desulfobacter sp.]
MTGHSNFQLNDVLWVDAELIKMEIDYGDVRISITESSEREIKILFKGYIGYSVIGFWDEIVIEKFVLHEKHPFLDSCIQELEKKYGKNLPPSGDDARNKKEWLLSELCLSDGTSILIVANTAEVIES